MVEVMTRRDACDVADVMRRLTVAFTDFEAQLEATPLIRRLCQYGAMTSAAVPSTRRSTAR